MKQYEFGRKTKLPNKQGFILTGATGCFQGETNPLKPNGPSFRVLLFTLHHKKNAKVAVDALQSRVMSCRWTVLIGWF